MSTASCKNTAQAELFNSCRSVFIVSQEAFFIEVRKTAAHDCVWMESLGKVNMLHGRYILQLIC